MKDFFKSHPQLLYLIIAVIVIDAGIIWMCLGDSAATAKSLDKLKTLEQQAKRINDSKLQTNSGNASKAEEEAAKIEKSYNEKFDEKLKQYTYDGSSKENFGSDKPKAKAHFKELLDGLADILKDRDKTTDNLSFKTIQDSILNSKVEDIKTSFEILNGFSKIIESCAQADIGSITEVSRPTELKFVPDSTLGTKIYTYKIKLTGSGDSIKRLINRISNNQEYFFEISSIGLIAEAQITSSDEDIKPNVTRTFKAEGANEGGGTLGDLERELEGGPAKEVDKEDVVIQKDSVSPFVEAVNQVELTIDWIQFVKKAAKKKSGAK